VFSAAESLDFERATRLRDEPKKLESPVGVTAPGAAAAARANGRNKYKAK